MSKVQRDPMEDLLRQAEPRPVPAPEETELVKAAVREEWIAISNRRNARRRALGFAIAATLVVAVIAAVNTLRDVPVDPVHVATVERNFGPVYVLREKAELSPTDDLGVVVSGQTIVTGENAGLALAWANGGSLRIDQGSRVQFTDRETVFLEDGRIYFDSHGSLGVGTVTDGSFLVVTEHGMVNHIGTQYMTEVDRDRLIVSVREGSVSIDGIRYDETVSAGQQATLRGQQRPAILNISRGNLDWEWVEKTTPHVNVDGKSLHEFLTWVCREMGLKLRYEGDAESEARRATLKGTVETGPAEALRVRLVSADLDWRIEEGVLYITE